MFRRVSEAEVFSVVIRVVKSRVYVGDLVRLFGGEDRAVS